MNITLKQDPQKFSEFIENQDFDLYKYTFLKGFVAQVDMGQNQIFGTSLVNFSGDGWILVLHGDYLAVYGENWSPNQFEEIEKVLNLKKIANYSLAGDNDLIEAMRAYYKIDHYRIEKGRIFYQATGIVNFHSESLKIEIGKLADVPVLSEMLQQYYHEEYDGANDKTIEEMKSRVISYVQSKKIYVLKDDSNDILSFCTINDPDIGILFTKSQYRNKGYAKMLLSFCSTLLVRKNGIVYLMTDKYKQESNKVSIAVGFEPIFEYVMMEMNPRDK